MFLCEEFIGFKVRIITKREVIGLANRVIRFLNDYHSVARMEYLKVEAPAVFMPLLFTAYTVAGLMRYYYFEAILAFLMVYLAGFIINSYADVKVDSRYKKYIARSAKRMGHDTLLMLFWVQCAIAMALTAHIAWIIGQWWILGLMAFLIFLAYGYSLPPFNFKTGGALHVVAICLGAFFLPAVFLFYVAGGAPTIPIWVFIFGFTTAHFGVSLVNQSGDFLEDRAEGLRTPAVRWGLARTLTMGTYSLLGGLVIMVIGFYFIMTGTPWFTGFEDALGIGIAGRFLFLALVCAVFFAGYSIPLRGILKIRGISLRDLPEGDMMKKIKTHINYPKWQGGGIWGLGIVSFIYFLVALTF